MKGFFTADLGVRRVVGVILCGEDDKHRDEIRLRLVKYIEDNHIKNFQWFIDDCPLAELYRSRKFNELIELVRSGTIKSVLSIDLIRIIERMNAEFEAMMHLASLPVVINSPENITMSSSELMSILQEPITKQRAEFVSQRIRNGLKKARERGVKLGAKKGENRRLGFRKKHDVVLVNEVLSRLGRMSYKKIGNDLKISAPTVCRIVKQYSNEREIK